MSRVFSFSRCPSELPSVPSIVALPCPILSSSHCVCVKKLVPPLGEGAAMPGWKAPGESAFWTPLVPLVWCSASLCCWVSLSDTPGGPLLQTPLTTVLEPSSLLKIPPSSECCYPVLKYPPSVIRHNWHSSLAPSCHCNSTEWEADVGTLLKSSSEGRDLASLLHPTFSVLFFPLQHRQKCAKSKNKQTRHYFVIHRSGISKW